MARATPVTCLGCLSARRFSSSFVFFFTYAATTELYTFPYTTLFRSHSLGCNRYVDGRYGGFTRPRRPRRYRRSVRSEEHTSELQSHHDLVCRLLLEKKKKRYRE